MLVSVLTKRHYMPLDQLARKIVDDAPRTILRPIEKLRASLKRDGQDEEPGGPAGPGKD